MPPDMCTALPDPGAAAETTCQVQDQTVKSEVSGAHYLSVLAAAAGTVRSAL